MGFLDIVLLVVLLVSAAFIVVAIVLQKSNEDGLSGTIAGGSETFYGKDKSADADRVLFKWTLIAAIVFGVAVLAVYVLQPDYVQTYTPDGWQDIINSGYGHIDFN